MSGSIEVENLSKVFKVRARAAGLGAAVRQLFSASTRDAVAVDGLSFTIEKGERVAFVGPNGAGKSTTLKMLTGILHPTGGDARVLGHVPWRDRTRLAYRIGTVFGQRTQLWYHLPAADTFALLARIYDQDRAVHQRRLSALVDAFGVGPLLDKPVRQLSLGERMRCELVASLLHGPEVLFLDEPTIGLDVTAKAVIRDLIRDTSRRDGNTVLLTSHDTGDMERVCDRVLVIHRGRLLLDEPIAALRKSYIRRKVVTLLTAEEDVRVDLPGVTLVEKAPHRTVLEVDVDRTPVEQVVQAALQASRLRDLTVEDPPMEEIVQAIYASAEAQP
ncbi:MAG: ABC transporter ATP-binding protein [Planctomycetota bacterium]